MTGSATTGSAKGDLGFIHRFEPGTGADTLLLLHGTGGDEHDLIPLGRQLAPQSNLLSPRGQTLENGMPRFFRRLEVGVFDEADLMRRAQELGQFVRAAATHYKFDPTRVSALGYSNGANMAGALLLLDGPLLAGAALLRAVLPLEPPQLPDLSNKQVVIAAGRQDPYAPAERVEALADRLTRAGAAVDLRWAEADHSLMPSDFKAIADWLAKSR